MADLLLILVTVVWGLTFVFNKEALGAVGPVQFTALRHLVALAGLLPLALLEARRRRRATATATAAAQMADVLDPVAWRAGAAIGLALFLGYLTQTVGLVWATPATSAFLTGVSVVLVPLFGVLLFRAKVNGWTWAGTIAAFTGLTLLTVRANLTLGVGELITAGTALAFAFHILLMGRFAPRVTPLALTVSQIAVATVLCLLALPLDSWLAARGFGPARGSGFFGPLPVAVWGAVVYGGLLGSAAAFLVQSWAQRSMPPTRVGVIYTLEPVFAALFSFLLVGERFGGRGALGMVLILAGMVIVETVGRRDGAAAADPAADPAETP